MFGQADDHMSARMDADNFRSKMNSLAYGNVMAKAAEDYKQELLASEAADSQHGNRQLDVGELHDDPELEKLHRDRLAELQREVEKRETLQRQGHGELQEVKESDFLSVVTQTQRVVCHFFHRDFERCKIMDKHLLQLAQAHFDTRFIRVSAPDAPFFTEKLQIKVLPAVVVFLHAIATEQLVGFDHFGNRDDFKTSELEAFLVSAGAVAPKVRISAVLPEHQRSVVRRGNRDEDDEDSDFSE